MQNFLTVTYLMKLSNQNFIQMQKTVYFLNARISIIHFYYFP